MHDCERIDARGSRVVSALDNCSIEIRLTMYVLSCMVLLIGINGMRNYNTFTKIVPEFMTMPLDTV